MAQTLSAAIAQAVEMALIEPTGTYSWRGSLGNLAEEWKIVVVRDIEKELLRITAQRRDGEV